MTKDELTQWALANGWRILEGVPSLCKPGRPKEAIVRLMFKTSVVNLEIRKPTGKWEKVSGAPYGSVHVDDETGLPRGLGLSSIPSLTKLMQDNKDQNVFGD